MTKVGPNIEPHDNIANANMAADGLDTTPWRAALHRRVLPAVCALLTACGGATDNSAGSSSDASSGDALLSSDGAVTQTDSATTGKPEPELAVCGKLIECATATHGLLTGIIAMYGENGECWNLFDAKACWFDCRAQLAALELVRPGVPECSECATDADCGIWEDPEAEFCGELSQACTSRSDTICQDFCVHQASCGDEWSIEDCADSCPWGMGACSLVTDALYECLAANPCGTEEDAGWCSDYPEDEGCRSVPCIPEAMAYLECEWPE